MYKVMVLDDDEQVRDGLVFFLEDEGFLVTGVKSAEEAFEKLQSESIEIVVVDLRLPGMDGSTFIYEAHRKWPEIKFIMYTGSPEFRIPEKLASLGCVSPRLFQKPLLEPDLMIREILNTISSR